MLRTRGHAPSEGKRRRNVDDPSGSDRAKRHAPPCTPGLSLPDGSSTVLWRLASCWSTAPEQLSCKACLCSGVCGNEASWLLSCRPPLGVPGDRVGFRIAVIRREVLRLASNKISQKSRESAQMWNTKWKNCNEMPTVKAYKSDIKKDFDHNRYKWHHPRSTAQFMVMLMVYYDGVCVS